MSDAKKTPGRGDNKPPGPPLDEIDPTKLVDASIVAPLLHLNFTDLEARRDEFVRGTRRWIEAHSNPIPGRKPPHDRTAPVIADEQDCANAQDYLKGQLRKFTAPNGEVDTARKRVKEPLDNAAKAVQGFFVDGIARPVNDAKQPIEDAYTAFLKAKEKRETDARRAAALEMQAEADRLAEQARRARVAEHKEALIDQAVQAEESADRLAQSAEAPTPELTRIRGDQGSVGGLKTTWHWRVENLIELVMAVVAGQQPIQMLAPNAAYIDSLVKPKDGLRKIPGLTVYPEQKAR